MIKLKIFLFLIFLVLGNSCSKESIQKSTIKEKSLEFQVLEAYQGGLEALDGGDALYAAKKFNEAEILFPQSKWAPKAALMAAYSYYTQDYYGDAISELNRFIKNYPANKNTSYAYFLLATCYYELIVDEKKDLSAILESKKYFETIINSKISLCFLRKLNRDLQTLRTVEIPSVGGFMLAERTLEHTSMFVEDDEAVFFGDDNELLQKVKKYLTDDQIREKIAKKGMLKSHAKFQLRKRLREIINMSISLKD